MIKTLFIYCKRGPHFVHKSFAKSVNSKLIPCCLFMKNKYFLIIEAFFRAFLFRKYNKIIVEGMESIYLARFIKFYNKKAKIIYHDADAFFFRDYPKFKGLKKIFIDFFLNKIDYIISDSKISKKFINKYIKKPTEVVYPFANTQKFNFKPNLESKNIIYVGRLADEKNLFTLLDAFILVKKEIKESKLYIIGDGPLKRKLKQYVKNKKIEDVFFYGWLNNFKKYLNNSIIGYNVSKFEPFGVSGLEYALSGVIPLLGNRNGNAEVLNKKEIICNPDSTIEIAKKIIKLIKLSKDKKLKLLKELRKKALKYNERNQCSKFQKSFHKLIEKNV